VRNHKIHDFTLLSLDFILFTLEGVEDGPTAGTSKPRHFLNTSAVLLSIGTLHFLFALRILKYLFNMKVKTADGDTQTNTRDQTLCSATPALCINAAPFYFFCQKKNFENFGGTHFS
jgi:hypothetical protein